MRWQDGQSHHHDGLGEGSYMHTKSESRKGSKSRVSEKKEMETKPKPLDKGRTLYTKGKENHKRWHKEQALASKSSTTRSNTASSN